MTDITMRQMFEAGVHYGHQVRYWRPEMAPYIYGVKDKIHIINLDKTVSLYQAAVNFAGNIAAKRGKILFVGTKAIAGNIICEEAKRCGMPYVNYRWLGGMLTNYRTIRQSVKRLKELEDFRDSPVFVGLSKKEALGITREISKLDRSLGGIRNMNGLPDALFVVDIGHDNIAVSEAMKLKIPIIGVVDTNHNPKGIDYVIPGNDDSARAIKLYIQGIADIIATVRSTLPVEATEDREVKKTMRKPQPKANKKVFTKVAVEVVPAKVIPTEIAVSNETKADEVKKNEHKVTKVVRKVKNAEEVSKPGKPKRVVAKVATKVKAKVKEAAADDKLPETSETEKTE